MSACTSHHPHPPRRLHACMTRPAPEMLDPSVEAEADDVWMHARPVSECFLPSMQVKPSPRSKVGAKPFLNAKSNAFFFVYSPFDSKTAGKTRGRQRLSPFTIYIEYNSTSQLLATGIAKNRKAAIGTDSTPLAYAFFESGTAQTRWRKHVETKHAPPAASNRN